jgi:hypothetical protein
MISTHNCQRYWKENFKKKAYFFEGNVFYYFCSVPDVLDSQNQNITRAINNYLGAVIIKEDNDIFNIDCYNQVDIKMSIPEISIVMTFPKKMKELFEGLLEYYNN